MNPTIIRLFTLITLAIATSGWSMAASRASLAKGAPRFDIETLDSVTASCVDIEKNALIFPGSFKYIDNFEKRLESLLRNRKGRITVWHVGGSHVQADILSHRMRCNFARLTGATGTRGMLFPFSMAKTNYGSDHRLSYTGNWTTARNIPADPALPLGITGISAATSDHRATVTVNLDNGRSPKWRLDALRVVCESNAPADSITLTVTDEMGHEWKMLPEADGRAFYADRLPVSTSATITIDNPTGSRFLLRGIEPLNSQEGVVNYYSSGINGASTLSWLRCEHLDGDLMRLKPDLVILGIGINDAAIPADKFDPEKFQARYRRILDKVRKANPNAMMLFITNNDTYIKSVPNTNAVRVRDAFVTLAKEYGGCVWDCFGVMGGLGSSARWRNADLMAKDRIHFTRKGYELCADLMFDALIADFIDNDE